MAGLEAKKDHRSHEMGMHTEGLLGRTQQRFFDRHRRSRRLSAIRTLRTSISTGAPNSTAPARDGADQRASCASFSISGVGTIVLRNPGSKHSIAVGILHRLNLHIEGSCGYFALRPDRRPEHHHQGPRRLGLRREHDGRHDRRREERRLAVRRGAARRRPRLQRLGRRHARASIRRAARSSSAATPARSPAS